MYGHLFFDKECKTYNGNNEASSTNDACLTGCLHVEECKWIHIYHADQVKVIQRLQHKTRNKGEIALNSLIQEIPS